MCFKLNMVSWGISSIGTILTVRRLNEFSRSVMLVVLMWLCCCDVDGLL
jgi:hypothetical protein